MIDDSFEPALKATTQNTRRYSALLFAGVTAITLSGIIAATSLKPQLYISSKGQSNQAIVQTIPTLIADCHFDSPGCYDPLRSLDPINLPADTHSQLYQYAASSGINPQVVITLAYLQGKDIANPKELQPIFQELQTLKSQVPATLPKVYTHPAYGTYKLENPTHSTVVLINYLAITSVSKTAFTSAVSATTPEGPTFITSFTKLFGNTP